MTKKITPKNNADNMKNKNIGNKGVNRQCAQNEGNRGKQLNINQIVKKK